MMRKYFSSALILSLTLIIATALSCRSKDFAPPPAIPVEYYKCLSVEPNVLVNAYYSRYLDITVAQTLYTDKIFILKNVVITNDHITHLRNEGFIWVDMIQCIVANTKDCERFRAGDKVDVIGSNKGPSMDNYGVLIFLDCFMIPAGALKLPADDSGQAVIVGY